MKKAVFHPKPHRQYLNQIDIDIWNEEYDGASLGDVHDVYNSEVWTILDSEKVLKGLILEDGCGHGNWVRALSQRGFNVHGLDFSEVGLRVLRKAMPHVPVTLADVRRLPYADETFNTILSWGVVEHLPEGPDFALNEIRRCLQSDGIAAISVPMLSWNRLLNPFVWARRLASRSILLRRLIVKGVPVFFQWEFSVDEFSSRLLNAGLGIVRWYPIWLEFGLQDDFRGFYLLMKRVAGGLNAIGISNRALKRTFGAFMLFLCERR